MDQSEEKNPPEAPKESFLKVIVHSFFVIPFLIAVFCVLLFAAMHLLTSEKRQSAREYLNDIKAGSETKRWQGAFNIYELMFEHKRWRGAFELSQRLQDKTLEDPKFLQDILTEFEKSKNDSNPLVQQYLALAMGRSGKAIFVAPLVKALKDSDETQLPTIIYSLGMLKHPETADAVAGYLDSSNARIRSIAAVSLGNIGNPASKPALRNALNDPEPNVQWGAAVSLAQMGDASGKEILLNLLDRKYLGKFPEVDAEEQTELMLAAIDAGKKLKDEDVINRLAELSKADQNMKIRSKSLEAVNH